MSASALADVMPAWMAESAFLALLISWAAPVVVLVALLLLVCQLLALRDRLAGQFEREVQFRMRGREVLRD